MNSEVIALDGDMEGATTLHTTRMIGETLEAHYPGWLWYVEVRGGVAIIKSMHANPRYGYTLNLVADHYSASDLAKQVLRAGGELLERLNMPRRRADWEAIARAPQSVHGFLEYAR